MERQAPLVRGLCDGVSVAACLWAIEVIAIAAINGDVGGWPVFVDLIDDLARWGLGYLALGAVAGALSSLREEPREVVVHAPWALALLVADPGVAPRLVYVAVVAVAAVLALLTRSVAVRVRGSVLVALTVVLALTALASVRAGPPVAGRPGDRPDVVVIVVDTLRRDRVGAYGPSPLTPAIDLLAREGRRYDRAWSTSSWTLPAHASLFTGLPPSAHGAVESNPRLSTGLPTLAERFRDAGYRTVGLSANAWVSAGTGLDRGFQRFGFYGDTGIADQLLLALALHRPEDLGGHAIADAAAAAIADAAAAKEPLFLFVNLLEAHEPLGTLPGVDPGPGRAWIRDMPRSWCTCTPAGAGPAAGDDGVGADLSCRDGLFRASDARVAAATALYEQGVAYDDARIGEIVAALRTAGRLDRTVLIVTSDHGEHLGDDGGRLGHMVWLTPPLLEIPLVVRFPPSVPAGSVDAAPIDLADVGPLVLALAAGTVPPARGAAEAEVGPHPQAMRDRLGAVYGCDFAAMGRTRAAVDDGGQPRFSDEIGVSRDGAAVDPVTGRQLEALGYARP